MRKSIESKPICPFMQKECIACGVTSYSIRNGVVFPCMFFDEYACSDTEPCLIKRAVNTILKRPDKPEKDEPVDIPY